MRLLELVACCGASAAARRRPADVPEEESETAAMAGRILEEETPSLVAQCARSHRRRKRGASSAGEEWKPSLCSISEDAAVTAAVAIEIERIGRDVRDHVDRAARSERPVKRKSAQGSSRTIVSVYSSDQRRPTFQTMIPAFSPTPFMF